MPEPEFADDAQRLALGDGDVDMLHGADDAAPRGELDGQVADIEQREGAVMARASRAPLRVDDVAQAVAQQIEAEHGDHQRQRRERRRSTIRPTP